ncbi:MAG: hypothetical protein HY897_18910 [Deltaproteobacteria bacterium]|nr:hypothetical protein [Deltaproteobacteria bacterium]
MPTEFVDLDAKAGAAAAAAGVGAFCATRPNICEKVVQVAAGAVAAAVAYCAARVIGEICRWYGYGSNPSTGVWSCTYGCMDGSTHYRPPKADGTCDRAIRVPR